MYSPEQGKITNWSGIAMASLGLTAEVSDSLNWTSTLAELTQTATPYLSPWANLAETAIQNDGDLSGADFLTAMAGTVMTAVNGTQTGKTNSFSNILERSTWQAGAGAFIGLVDREAGEDYLINALGNEIGGFIGHGLVASTGLGDWSARQTDAFRAQQLQAHEHRQLAQQMQADNRTIIDQLGEHYGITDEHLSALLQQSENGDFDLAFQGIEGLTDQDGHVAYGAYDRESGSILLNQDLINRAQSGDQQAAAHLRAVMLEEQTHAIADSLQTLLGIDDLAFDEGALVARSMLGDLAQQGGSSFMLNLSGQDNGQGNSQMLTFGFDGDAARAVRNEHFTWSRIVADHQSADGQLQYFSGVELSAEERLSILQNAVHSPMGIISDPDSAGQEYLTLLHSKIGQTDAAEMLTASEAEMHLSTLAQLGVSPDTLVEAQTLLFSRMEPEAIDTLIGQRATPEAVMENLMLAVSGLVGLGDSYADGSLNLNANRDLDNLSAQDQMFGLLAMAGDQLSAEDFDRFAEGLGAKGKDVRAAWQVAFGEPGEGESLYALARGEYGHMSGHSGRNTSDRLRGVVNEFEAGDLTRRDVFDRLVFGPMDSRARAENIFTRAMGGIQAAFGAAEVVVGGAMVAFPEPATSALGALIAVHGADNAIAGSTTMVTGNATPTLLEQGLVAAGMSERDALIGSMVMGLGVGMMAGAAQAERLGRLGGLGGEMGNLSRGFGLADDLATSSRMSINVGDVRPNAQISTIGKGVDDALVDPLIGAFVRESQDTLTHAMRVLEEGGTGGTRWGGIYQRVSGMGMDRFERMARGNAMQQIAEKNLDGGRAFLALRDQGYDVIFNSKSVLGHANTSASGRLTPLRPDIQIVAPDNAVHMIDFTTPRQASKIFKYDHDLTRTLLNVTYD